jgi:hypothetical protein
MDMTGYAGDMYLRVEDFRDSGPKRLRIDEIGEGQFDKPVLRFNDNSLLSINATNAKTLIRAYGPESDDWIGKEIELCIGETQFQGRPKDSILVKPVSPPIPIGERKTPKPSKPTDDPHKIDDDIPF